MTDQMRKSAAARGEQPSASDGFGGLFAGAGDSETILLLLRVLNLLEQPSVLMEQLPALQARADAAPKPAEPAEPKVKGPTRADLLAVVA
jgi:hypothetical protein